MRTGKPPKTCNFCDHSFAEPREGDIAIDGKTVHGPWAWMCIGCHVVTGVGIGLGVGQLYQYSNKHKAWVKTGG